MNDVYYAVVIEKRGDGKSHLAAGFYFQLINHGMSTLHFIKTDYYESQSRTQLFSLPDGSGWLAVILWKGRRQFLLCH
jgi:hypothetical protein